MLVVTPANVAEVLELAGEVVGVGAVEVVVASTPPQILVSVVEPRVVMVLGDVV